MEEENRLISIDKSAESHDVNSGKPYIHGLSHLPSFFFTYRDFEMALLEKSFSEDGNCKIQVLSGSSGTGKTYLALEYISRFSENFTDIFFLNKDSLYEDYRSIALEKGIIKESETESDVTINAVKSWMLQNDKWLAVFDDIDSFSSLKNFIPHRIDGCVIVTTTSKDWNGKGNIIPLLPFTEEEAVEFLVKRTGLDDIKGATKIFSQLSGIPHNLEIAGAYISSAKITFGKFLELIKSSNYSKKNILSLEYLVMLSLNKLENEEARQLLYICSLMASASIPEYIFTNSCDSLPPKLLKLVNNNEQYKKIIEDLSSMSLLCSMNGFLTIHQSIKKAITSYLAKQDEILIWCGYSTRMLYSVFSKDRKEKGSWIKFSSIVPHVLSVTRHCMTYRSSLVETAWLCNESGGYISSMHRYTDAEPFYRKAFELCIELLGRYHTDTANTMNNLADLYRILGKYHKAEVLYKKAYSVRKKVLGDKHPSTITTMNYLAQLYYHLGKYSEAEQLYKKVLKAREKTLGPNHPYTADTLKNMARLYEAKGKYEDGKTLLIRALKIYDETLGPDHLETASVLNDLASFFRISGEYDKAEILFGKALEMRERMLGRNHPSTATTVNFMGMLYHRQGRFDEAEDLFRRALATRIQVLGVNHIYTAATLGNLAELYEEQGKYDDAEKIYKRVLEIYKAALGHEHTYTAAMMNSLAGLYMKQGRYDEAMPLFKEALAVFDDILES